MKKTITLSFLLFLSACSTLSPEGKKVVIISDPKYVSMCTQVGFVSSKSNGRQMNSSSDSMTEMKNMTAKMGQVLLMTKDEYSLFTGIEREGIVYKCPENIVFKQN